MSKRAPRTLPPTINPRTHVDRNARGLRGNPLCSSWDGPDAPPCPRNGCLVLGPVRPWDGGRGYQRLLWCTRCETTGEQSCSMETAHAGGGGVLFPDPRKGKGYHGDEQV